MASFGAKRRVFSSAIQAASGGSQAPFESARADNVVTLIRVVFSPNRKERLFEAAEVIGEDYIILL